MVEPISIALLSGAAGFGLALGRFTKSSDSKEQKEPEKPIHINTSKLHFFQVTDLVDTQEIIQPVLNGDRVFVNIRKLITATDKLYKFLFELNKMITRYDLQLHQITKELILVSRPDDNINVETLQKITKINEIKENDPLLPDLVAS